MNFIPLNKRILVRREEEPKEEESLIVTPETAEKEKPQRGRVLAVDDRPNEEGKRRQLPAGVGELIMFGKYTGSEITVDKEALLVIKEEDILGVLTGE